MKTKTVSKEYYIDKSFFYFFIQSHKTGCEFQKDLAQFFTKNHNGKMIKIKVSWEEIEQAVTITESEWDEVIKDTCYSEKSGWLADVLKKKLFNKKLREKNEN